MSIAPKQPPADKKVEPSVDKPPKPPADRGVGQAYLLFAICICVPANLLKGGDIVGQAYLLFAICLCLSVSVGWAAQISSPYFGLAVIETLILLLAVLFVRRKRLPIAASLGWRPISPATALVSVVIGVSGLGIAMGIQSLAIPFIGEGPDRSMNITTLGDLVIALICASLLPGVCEETFFRGAIQGTLNRRGPVKSVLITALLFALFHVDRWNFLPPLISGAVAGIMTLRTGSTIPAMIAHSSWNATACVSEYLFRGEPDPYGFLTLVALLAAFVLAFSIFLVKTRHHPFEPGPLARVPASLSRRALAATAAGTIIFVWLALFVVSNWLGWHFVTANEESLGLNRGARVLLLKGPLARIGLAAGDIVEIESDGRSRLGKIERCDQARVWLVGWPDGAPLNRREITGRPIQIVDLPSE